MVPRWYENRLNDECHLYVCSQDNNISFKFILIFHYTSAMALHSNCDIIQLSSLLTDEQKFTYVQLNFVLVLFVTTDLDVTSTGAFFPFATFSLFLACYLFLFPSTYALHFLSSIFSLFLSIFLFFFDLFPTALGLILPLFALFDVNIYCHVTHRCIKMHEYKTTVSAAHKPNGNYSVFYGYVLHFTQQNQTTEIYQCYCFFSLLVAAILHNLGLPKSSE